MSKKITLALAMIGLSSTALAGAPGNNVVPPSGITLIAPVSTGNWNIGLEALYMQSDTNFQYASLPVGINEDGEIQTNNQTVNSDWNWGGEVDVSYIFPGSARDISGSYTYLNQDGSESITDVPGPTTKIIGVGLTGIPDLPLTTGVDADVDQTLNAATLTVGQFVTVGNRVGLHPFGGLQFADIDTRNQARYDAVAPISGQEVLTGNYNASSEFEGIGPRAGMDAHVLIGCGFSLVGTMAGALLVGNMDSNFNIDEGALAATPFKSKDDSYTAIVPELDAKVGLNYMYAFNPATSMDVQLGYEVVDYFNAENNDFIDSFAVNSVNSSSDFNYNGPYLRLQLNVV
ncbi:MAG: hypothetical protein HKM04_06660 [Legionellales bacterium]|nr:hypothetical protein [Legionellales bacterium]